MISKKKQLNPALTIMLGFAIIIIVGTILLALPISSSSQRSAGFVSSLFTATSAVCVTGLVVVDTGTSWSIFGQSIILILIQVGGLGFMTVGTMFALILGKRISLKERLLMQESLNVFTIGGVVKIAKYILLGTFIVEGIGAIMLSFRFIPEFGVSKGVFYSIFHSVSAFCNAGFDVLGKGTSFIPYVGDVVINITLWALIIFGGLGFYVVIDIIKAKKFTRLSLHSKIVILTTAALIILGTLLIFALEINNPSTIGQANYGIKEKVLGSVFHSVTPRTAGFNTLDTGAMSQGGKFVTIILMFIGGSPGSTAGGIKTATFAVLIITAYSVILGKRDAEIDMKRISLDVVLKAFAIVSISLGIVVFVTTLLTITENFSFLDLFFESVSAFATVGMSTGITSELSVWGKIVIIFTMFVGRVGPLTIAIGIARRQKANKALLRYPEKKIIVG